MEFGLIFDTVFRLIAHAGSAFDSLARTCASVAVTALWQGIAVASGLAICLKLLPRISATHRFFVWSFGFCVLIVLPFLPLVSNLAMNTSAMASPSILAANSTQALLQIDHRWSLVLAVLWIVASLLRAVDLILNSFRLRRLWRTAFPAEPPIRRASVGAFRRPVEICTTKEIDRPSVIGFFAPRILIPDWLFARLTPGELEQIILHETEHLRRCDDWTNLFQKLCLVVFPLDPALWWIERQLTKEREMACDEGVVRITHAPRAYAACLTSLAERGLERSAEALSLGAWHRRPELVHRVHSILRSKREMHPLASRALLAGMGCGLLMASVELMRCPQFVAFAPPQNTEPALATVRQHAEPAQFIDAAYTPSRYRTNATPKFYALQAKAVMTPLQPSRVHQQRLDSQSTATRSLQASIILPASPTTRRQDLKNELPPQPVAAHEEQWIVFTEWEQVEAPAPQTVSDYDTGAAPERPVANSKAQPSAKSAAAKPANVTGLIFKVLPEDSTQPRAVSLGNGWFVIQL